MKPWQKKLWQAVRERDNDVCIWCPERASEVHHIIPRSTFGRKTQRICWQMKNMCCICAKCHAKAAGYKAKVALLKIMSKLYGYTYDDYPFCQFKE